PEAILSDEKLAEMLAEEGIMIARRTVAKYREGLKIASSAVRRRAAKLRAG
ncbi:MAG: RNA polymerase sigma-54 factor, partial [Parvibaculales bacterium]